MLSGCHSPGGVSGNSANAPKTLSAVRDRTCAYRFRIVVMLPCPSAERASACVGRRPTGTKSLGGKADAFGEPLLGKLHGQGCGFVVVAGLRPSAQRVEALRLIHGSREASSA